jgi:hypothetical protein
MVDIKAQFMFAVADKTGCAAFLTPGSSAFDGQLRQNEAHPRPRAGHVIILTVQSTIQPMRRLVTDDNNGVASA